MRRIIYYVAISLDGFISGPNEDISGFVGEGDGVSKYLSDLAHFDTVIMGRSTYEFGYKFGLKPGKPPYPHMSHYIFSNTLTFENPDPKVQVKPVKIGEIEKIRGQAGTDIYLCGGGQFAGWLWDNALIDIIKIKLNPLILGSGTRIFGESKRSFKLELKESTTYEKGLQFITYIVKQP